VNKDGFDDFIISSVNNDKGGNNAGQTYLILGRATGWVNDVSLANVNASFIGEAAGDGSGSYVAGVGDVNGDGFDDFAIGAPGYNVGEDDWVGKSYLIFDIDGTGIIPVDKGVPFYTNKSTNPYAINLNENDSEIVTFWVNVTGGFGRTYEFSAYANLTSDLGIGNFSNKINLTFVEDADKPQITIISPTATTYTSSSISFEVRTNENSTCNYSVDSGATNSSLTANSTGTGHTVSTTLGNGDYTANYYCTDLAGNTNSTENVSFSVSVSSSSEDSLGGSATYKPTQEQLEEGYSKLLRKTQKVQFVINGETHTAVVNSVNSENKKVEIELEEINKTIELDENKTEKINLNDDGYYDLQILVRKIQTNGYANLEFKEIHEEIPAGKQEAKQAPSKTEKIGIKNWVWIFGGAILLVFIGFVIRKVLKWKRFKY